VEESGLTGRSTSSKKGKERSLKQKKRKSDISIKKGQEGGVTRDPASFLKRNQAEKRGRKLAARKN